MVGENIILINETSDKIGITNCSHRLCFEKEGSKFCSLQESQILNFAIITFSSVSSFIFNLNLFLVLFTILKILSYSALLWGVVKIDKITFAISL